MNTGQLFLNACLLGLGTWFWCWYLVHEGNRYKGKTDGKKWYEREIFGQERKDQ